MNVQRGEIVIVDFPYSDQTASKIRPALIVQAVLWNPLRVPQIFQRGIGLQRIISVGFRLLLGDSQLNVTLRMLFGFPIFYRAPLNPTYKLITYYDWMN